MFKESKGSGTVSLEHAKLERRGGVCLLVFRNRVGATLFSANVIKGVSKHRIVTEKPHKC